MNVYDFDNTIYDGECTVDFFCFCLKKRKTLIFQLPKIVFTAILYKLKLLSQSTLLDIVGSMSKIFIKNKVDMNQLAIEFWINNNHKLKKDFIDLLKSDDVIITASPYFIVEKISNKLKTRNLIASDFDYKKGVFRFLCYKENKALAFNKMFPKGIIENFYTDSYNDKAMIQLSRNAYLIKNKKIIKIK